jgi:hypothetical protein
MKLEESVQSRFRVSSLHFATLRLSFGHVSVRERSTEREVRLCLRHVPVRSKGNGIWNGEFQIQQLGR